MRTFKPDFEQIQKVLKREKPDRPVLFECFIDYVQFGDIADSREEMFFALGYDYASIKTNDISFPQPYVNQAYVNNMASVSQSEEFAFNGREDFEKFEWRDPDPVVYREEISRFEKIIPAGGKLIGALPQSVLGGMVKCFGYENLCLLCYDDPELVADASAVIADKLLKHVEIISSFDCVGAMILNDDWGYNKQTRLSPEQTREYIIPKYKRMVEAVHSVGKPTILHSCGNIYCLMDDICDVCKFDGKHSYEDTILSVEEAYKKYSSRIAIMGGIDLDFLCRKTPEEVAARANGLLDLSEENGGYALGSGNSIANYVPRENYMTMIEQAHKRR